MKYSLLFFLAFFLCIASCKKDEPDGRSSSVLRLCATHNPIYLTPLSTSHVPPLISDTFRLYFPNVITPNNDGSNDVFAINGSWHWDSLATFQFTIRDSSNTFVFTGDSVTATWDGKINGVHVPETNYLVTVNGSLTNGQTFNLRGSLSVFYCYMGDTGVHCSNPVYYNVNCDTCMFGSQWDGAYYNTLLPTNEFFVEDPYHNCD
jgi:gliding motility-associated-like protein